MELYGAGELSKARALCEDIVRRRPGISLSWLQLAYLNRETGDLRAAVEAARRALLASPDNVDAASLLGAYLNESGRAQETVALLSPYAQRSDPDLDVLNALGAALAQTGRAAEGLAMLERVLGVDPSNAMTHVNIGTIHLMSRDYARARAAFEAALTLEPTLARAHNSVGVIEAETGNQDAAIEAWKKAVSLNPREYDTLYNLGTLLIRGGRTSEARRYLEQFERGAPAALYGPELRNARAWLTAPRPGPSGEPE
jgi:tetratricopeptide (TPR) repeat protein